MSPICVFDFLIEPEGSSITKSYTGFHGYILFGFKFFFINTILLSLLRIMTSMQNLRKKVCIPNRVVKTIACAFFLPIRPKTFSSPFFREKFVATSVFLVLFLITL